MSKEIFLSQTFGLQDKDAGGKLTGKFEGVANSGQPVKDHWGMQNLITDIESLSFKDQIPIFLNHWSSDIVGFASLEVRDKQLWVSGQISKSTEEGRKVLALADEGFKWELSIGVTGNYEEIRETAVEVNGYESPVPSTIIRQGRVFEVSFCPIGADDQTYVNVFNKQNKLFNKKGEIEMSKKVEFDAAAWAKFACACGGDANSTLAELEEVLVDEDELQVLKDENETLKAEIEELKKAIAELKEQLEEVEAEVEAEETEAELSKLAKAKGIELSAEKLKELASDKDKAKMFLEMASAMKDAAKKIPNKFTKAVKVTEGSSTFASTEDKAHERKKKAHELAKAKGITFAEAIGMLPDEDYK